MVRLGKDWDRKRKDRLQKERNAKGKSYVIPKLGSTSASPGVGSTPTPALLLSTPVCLFCVWKALTDRLTSNNLFTKLS